ncbi:hypothetical protein D7W79_09925 [Corallococcus exercitus]|uniref:DUF7919 family protein n=1 Tax=Corallococcus exercitus TaxID=2316736 RepID=UPI000EA22A3C|nr:hypothetical protein [Corallococcus exercitus]RKG79627.1 hypothetical protein D7W79_09925 [Corallococcus exercitus]
MAWFEDLTPCSDPGEGGKPVLAVGWIDHLHAYARGHASRRFVMRLVELLEDPWQPRRSLGWHTCGLCRFTEGPRTFELEDGPRVKLGTSNLFIPAYDRLYIAPSMMVHAVDAHGYAPPEEFVKAVLVCPPMRSPAYLAALRDVAPPWLLEAGPLPRMSASARLRARSRRTPRLIGSRR